MGNLLSVGALLRSKLDSHVSLFTSRICSVLISNNARHLRQVGGQPSVLCILVRILKAKPSIYSVTGPSIVISSCFWVLLVGCSQSFYLAAISTYYSEDEMVEVLSPDTTRFHHDRPISQIRVHLHFIVLGSHHFPRGAFLLKELSSQLNTEPWNSLIYPLLSLHWTSAPCFAAWITTLQAKSWQFTSSLPNWLQSGFCFRKVIQRHTENQPRCLILSVKKIEQRPMPYLRQRRHQSIPMSFRVISGFT